MRIVCTVEEFGKIVRGCNEMARSYGCINCPLHDVCGEEVIEHFIAAEDVVPDDGKEEDTHAAD